MSDHEYRQRCGCRACKDECNRRKNEYRARIRREGPIPHGTQNGYVNFRCRCEKCAEAGQAAHERSCARRYLARFGISLDDVVRQDA